MKKAPGRPLPPNETPVELRGESLVDLPRLYAFSDGVFAIAITLLSLEIRFPEVAPDVVATRFWPTLATMVPAMFAFVQSFVIIGIFWIVHHRVFRLIKRGDNTLLWLNLAFLLLVAFLPVPSALVARYLFEPVTMSFYVMCVALLGAVNLLLWRYASHNHRLIDPDLGRGQIRYITLRAAVVPVVSLVTLGLYTVWPVMMYGFGYFIMAAFFVVGRVYGQAKRTSV